MRDALTGITSTRKIMTPHRRLSHLGFYSFAEKKISYTECMGLDGILRITFGNLKTTFES